MRGIEFHDREKETKDIRAILDSRPTLITFFIDPTQRTIKPQSRLNLLALREVLRR
jgi:hypothetical protein